MQLFSPDQIEYTFNIGEAVDLMRYEDALIARKGWNGKNMFLFYVPGSSFKVNRPPLNAIYEEGTDVVYQPHIDMKTVDDTIVPWLCSQTDLLANDYGIIGRTHKNKEIK